MKKVKKLKPLTPQELLRKECVEFLFERGVRLNFKNYCDYIAPDDPWGHVQLMKFYIKVMTKYQMTLTEVMEQMLLAFELLTEGDVDE